MKIEVYIQDDIFFNMNKVPHDSESKKYWLLLGQYSLSAYQVTY